MVCQADKAPQPPPLRTGWSAIVKSDVKGVPTAAPSKAEPVQSSEKAPAAAAASAAPKQQPKGPSSTSSVSYNSDNTSNQKKTSQEAPSKPSLAKEAANSAEKPTSAPASTSGGDEPSHTSTADAAKADEGSSDEKRAEVGPRGAHAKRSLCARSQSMTSLCYPPQGDSSAPSKPAWRKVRLQVYQLVFGLETPETI
jgi:hypothetical protein